MGAFQLAFERFKLETLEKADAVVAEAVQEIFYRIVDRSPVDTGFFRACWGYQVGSPANVSKSNTGTTDSPMAPPSVIVDLPALGMVHYISNDLSYAWRLEAGYSGKAPQGMVGLTVAEFDTIVRDAAAKGRAS